jgi:hypothetical protein
VLCGAGAVLAWCWRWPLVAMVCRYAARFSIRALDVTVDSSVLWVGAGLAMAAAVLLAYVPRLPSPHAPAGLGLRAAASGSRRAPTAACESSRPTRLRSRSCCSPARACSSPRSSPADAPTGYDMRQVLVFNIPASGGGPGLGFAKAIDFLQQIAAHQRVAGVCRRGRGRQLRAWLRSRQPGSRFQFRLRATRRGTGKKIRAADA